MIRFAVAVAVGFFSVVAHAGGINHFEAAAGPHNYVVTNHPAVLPDLVPSAWMLVSYANDPLVFRDDTGKQIGNAIVANQVNVEIAAALGLFDRFEVGVVAPAYFMNGSGLDGEGLTAFGTGDLRVLGKVLLTPWNDGFVASFRLSSDLIPIAQLISSDAAAGALAGDVLPNVTPAFSIGFNSEYVRVGLDTGVLIRAPREIAGNDLVAGSQITYGVGLEVAIIPKALFAVVDVNGRASPAIFGSDRDRFPLEGDLALKYYAGPIMLMGGGGTGLIPDYGSPDFRVFAAIGYFDRPPPEKEKPVEKDRDGDGIIDRLDECPDDPEDIDKFEDDDGCPEPDNDRDGIFDSEDSCPMEPEDKDNWQDDDGCPEDDNDGDGIEDGTDECPNDPEVKNGFEDADGCPDEATKKKTVVVKRDRIEITDKVFFAYDSDRILPKSYELLDNVAKVVNEHTEIDRIFIQGHTDSDGNEMYNLSLSDKRAKSVMRYLTETGQVDKVRLKAKGFGESQPIADNTSEDGKQTNRRVEFLIEEDKPKEGDKAKPDAKPENLTGKELKAKDPAPEELP
ncbi:MAG: OmpA family protein [Deltaproteobacteria bacterium]|nr:OmpA family protein [Deltaproteobacteria bacterium]